MEDLVKKDGTLFGKFSLVLAIIGLLPFICYLFLRIFKPPYLLNTNIIRIFFLTIFFMVPIIIILSIIFGIKQILNLKTKSAIIGIILGVIELLFLIIFFVEGIRVVD